MTNFCLYLTFFLSITLIEKKINVSVEGFDTSMSDRDVEILLRKFARCTIEGFERYQNNAILTFGTVEDADQYCGTVWERYSVLDAFVITEKSKSSPRKI